MFCHATCQIVLFPLNRDSAYLFNFFFVLKTFKIYVPYSLRTT